MTIDTDYADLKGKGFFPDLIKYMAAGPVVAMVWEGLDAVKTGRAMLGATNPLTSPVGASGGPLLSFCHAYEICLKVPSVVTTLSLSAATSAMALMP
jgi:hypothetical protein